MATRTCKIGIHGRNHEAWRAIDCQALAYLARCPAGRHLALHRVDEVLGEADRDLRRGHTVNHTHGGSPKTWSAKRCTASTRGRTIGRSAHFAGLLLK